MSIDLADADKRNATLTLKLKAKSGYSSTGDYKVSPNEWGAILKFIEELLAKQVPA